MSIAFSAHLDVCSLTMLHWLLVMSLGIGVQAEVSVVEGLEGESR